MDDHGLLQEYVAHRSEQAFAELVERHLPLVYGTALRLVRDPHTAQDVAQTVFIQLARKPWSVYDGHALTGWLYRATQHVGLSTLRSDQRRRVREAEAMKLAEENQSPIQSTEQFAPLLDEALRRLSRVEQDAVLLHYLQGKGYREVGAVLGVEESAARKRVERSLEKIRLHFVRRGVTTTAALLASAITAHATTPPAGLAVKIAGASLSGAASAGGVSHLIAKILFMSTKTKIILTVVVVAALAAIPLGGQYRQLQRVREDADNLAKQNTSLAREVAKLKTQLQETTVLAGGLPGKRLPSTVVSAEATSRNGESVSLDLNTVAQLSFTSLDMSNFTLTPEAVSLLGLTDAENAQMRDIMAELRKRIQAHSLATMREVPLDKVGEIHDTMAVSTDVAKFFREHEGRQSVYRIEPFPRAESTALTQWFADSTKNLLGEQRSNILIDKAQGAFNNWLSSEGTTVAFADNDAGEGGRPVTSWMIRTLYMLRVSEGPEAVPPDLQYLFEEVKQSQQTPEPTAQLAPQP